MNPFKLIDKFLDGITMYRLVLYYLIVLIGIATGLSATGHLSYDPVLIVFSAGFLVAMCWITNDIFRYVFEAPTNLESSFITALILALIITPIHSIRDVPFLAAAAGLAISSKYILAIGKKHIFNPAAIAVVLTAFGASQAASWWVGNGAMLPYVLIGGLLLIRKLRRFRLAIVFSVTAIVVTLGLGLLAGHGFDTIQRLIVLSPLVFFATVMLTEPLTMPGTAGNQTWYAMLAGILFAPQVHVGSLYSTPELALVVSNVFSYLVNPKFKLMPKLQDKLKLAPDTMDFVFVLEKPIEYKPGQYTEWTLPHDGADARGVRRYFTLASSPTEPTLRLGVKFYSNGSSFKGALQAMNQRSLISTTHVAGDFIMPEDTTRKLAFIAGGIGVTPYRSMIKYLVDTNEKRDTVLLYSEKNSQELVYTEVFEQARTQLGIKTTYFLTDPVADPSNDSRLRYNMITPQAIKAEIPDYAERLFYLSGSHPMVKAMEHNLHQLGVSMSQIKTDYFPGYA